LIPLETISKLDPDACPIILDAIFAQSSTGLAVMDRQLSYVWVNPAFAVYSGVPAEKHIGQLVGEILGERAWLESKGLLESALSGTPVVEQVLSPPLYSENRSIDAIRTSYYPLKTTERIFGVLAIVVDHSKFVEAETKLLKESIAERKAHEQKLLEHEDRLNLALRGGKLGTWQLSLREDVLIDASAICKQCFGFAADEPFNYTDIVQAIHPDDLPGVLQAIEASRHLGSDYQAEYRTIWRDGSEHWISATAQPTFDENGVPLTLIGISQDISHRKIAEKEKTELLGKIREFAITQAAFFRDVLASVTDGKLRLCQSSADLPARGELVGDVISLTVTAGLNVLRKAAKEAAITLGFTDERWQDFITAVSEAGMNAVVHAGGGKAQVYTLNGQTVQVWVRDTGKGIDLEDLPRATLEKGYTTTGTMGHGMKMMLQTADRVWLLTGPRGTTLVIEQDRLPHKREWE